MSVFWDEIVPKVRAAIRPSGVGEAVWFRGQRLEEWPLRSKLHRSIVEQLERDKLDIATGPDFLWGVGASFYSQFRNESWPLLQHDQRDPWELLFVMQHHGVPTAFLDWSESFASALFFAQRNRKRTDTGAVFILYPERMNKVLHKRDGLILVPSPNYPTDFDLGAYHPATVRDDRPTTPVAVAPHFAHPRMKAQRSTFVLCGSAFEPLDKQPGVQIQKILLTPDTFDDAEEFLTLAGAKAGAMFPDLGGVADEINARPI